ncbi:hypothetical protein ACFVR6_02425 [Microbacterium sp. NPDC058021]|uniref:hypothetical protein n=1 Tax=Microbacterium sp. NPDC058021 TaxID=3346306 RepID=UPI0036DC692A
MFRKTARTTTALAAVTLGAMFALGGCAGGSAPGGLHDRRRRRGRLDLVHVLGNDVRAELYDEAIAEFESQHTNIDIKVIFLAPQDYWEKRQIGAAGTGLPDVVTIDLA